MIVILFACPERLLRLMSSLSILSRSLLSRNKQRVSLGLLLGSGFAVLSKIFAEPLKTVQLANIAALNWYEFLILGLFLIYIPLIIRYFFMASPSTDDTDLAFHVIRKAKRAGVPKKILDEMYEDVVEAVLKNTVLKEEVKKEIAAAEQEPEPVKTA